MSLTPDTVWLADITYIATGEGWLYLAAVMGLATPKIIRWWMRHICALNCRSPRP